MKRILLVIICFFLFLSSSFSQGKKDYVYLKNGTIVVGTIIQEIQYDQIILRTDEGSLLSFKFAEIEKILQKDDWKANIDQYGGDWSIGIALGGGGIIGLPTRYFLNSRNALEIGTYYKPGLIKIYEEDDYGEDIYTYFLHSLVVTCGWNYYIGSYYKAHRQKIKLNGITFKGGIGTGDFDSYMIAAGWIHESFRKNNKQTSFNLELGPGYILTNSYDKARDASTSSFAIYWKIQWNLFY